MLKNYLKIAWRTFWKNPVVSFVNVSGLAMGLVVALLILLYVAHEYSFDRFHEKGKQIVKSELKIHEGADLFSVSTMSYKFGAAVKNASPGVVDFGRITEKGFGSKLVESDVDHVNFEPDFRFADAGFVQMFSFQFVAGNPKKALTSPGTVLLTESAARKYFGETNPLGKVIMYDKKHRLEIIGVLKDSPTNSSIQFDFLADLETWRRIETEQYLAVMDQKTAKQWLGNIGTGGSYETYFLLNNRSNREGIEKVIPKLLTESEQLKGAQDSYKLIPLCDLHFSSISPSSHQRVIIFSVIAGLILLLALINYVNLTTARLTVRIKEVSVRKIVGAARKALIYQFYLESVLYVTMAYVLASFLFVFLRPVFYKTLQLSIDESFLLTPFFLIPVLVFWVISVVLSGSYPALLLSGVTPIKAFKSDIRQEGNAHGIRQGLTVVQFTVSISLIIGSVLVSQQLDFFLHKDLGINRNRIATIFLDPEDGLDEHYSEIKGEVGGLNGVESVTASNLLMYGDYMNSWKLKRAENGKTIDVNSYPVDDKFVKTMNLEWAVAPANRHEFSSGNSIVINETAARQLGINGKNYQQTLDLGSGITKELVGIVKDFHYVKLAQKIKPMAMFIGQDSVFRNYLYVKIAQGASVPETIASIGKIYNRYKKAKPFEYAFLDDTYRHLYASELEMGQIVSALTAFGILIACLGLFGLVTFTAEQRAKEIGIRKVLGASVAGIVALLSVDFIKLVGIAVLISFPVAWWIMDSWLQTFAYKIEMKSWVFILAGGGALFIALLTVSFQSIKAALMNPVKSLKRE